MDQVLWCAQLPRQTVLWRAHPFRSSRSPAESAKPPPRRWKAASAQELRQGDGRVRPKSIAKRGDALESSWGIGFRVNFVSLEGIQELVDTAVELVGDLAKQDGR